MLSDPDDCFSVFKVNQLYPIAFDPVCGSMQTTQIQARMAPFNFIVVVSFPSRYY